MSVIVLGIEMPDTCEECRISIEVGSDMHCQLFTGDGHRDFGRKAECGFECRPDWCPLRPLPEKHGRLVDTDSFNEMHFTDGIKEGDKLYVPFIEISEIIFKAPTIVESEGE